MIKTNQVTNRRPLRFGRLDDIVRDLEVLNNRVEAGGKVHASGNWTPGQVVDHVAKMIVFSLDGFPPDAKPTLLVRAILRMLKSSALIKPMKPGIRLKGKMAAALGPDPDVTWGQAMTRLRNVTERVRGGERMTHSSPAFGAMAHEEWIQLHCRHAELHLSFLGAA